MARTTKRKAVRKSPKVPEQKTPTSGFSAEDVGAYVKGLYSQSDAHVKNDTTVDSRAAAINNLISMVGVSVDNICRAIITAPHYADKHGEEILPLAVNKD